MYPHFTLTVFKLNYYIRHFPIIMPKNLGPLPQAVLLFLLKVEFKLYRYRFLFTCLVIKVR